MAAVGPPAGRRALAGRLSRNELMLVCARFGLLSVNRVASVLMAATIVMAAMATFLQVNASANAGDAGRRAQKYAIMEAADRVLGQAQVNSEFRWYQNWVEADWMRVGQKRGSPEETRYRSLSIWLRTEDPRRARETQLLSAEYFRPPQEPDLKRYEAATFEEGAAETAERQTIAAQQKAAWSAKTTSYFAHLTFFAVALFLLGLTISVPGRRPDAPATTSLTPSKQRWRSWISWLSELRVIRLVFLVAGVGFIVIAGIWMLVVYIQKSPELSQTAIQHYSRGIGLQHQARYDEAITQFERAIRCGEEVVQQDDGRQQKLRLGCEPNYAKAWKGLGRAYSDRGFSRADVWELAESDFVKALEAYEQALAKAGDDLGLVKSITWSQGWLSFLVGDFEAAIERDRQQLRTIDQEIARQVKRGSSVSRYEGGQLGVRANLALVYLTTGRIEEAREEFGEAMRWVTSQVAANVRAGDYPPSQFWSLLQEVALDLENLLARLRLEKDKQWLHAPSFEKINKALLAHNSGVSQTDVEREARAMHTEVRSLTVALQRQSTDGLTAPGSVSSFGLGPKPATRMNELTFGVPARNESDRIASVKWLHLEREYLALDAFPYGLNEVVVLPRLVTRTDGKLVFRVFHEGTELNAQRKTVDLRASATQDPFVVIGFPFSSALMSEGLYRVEVYLQDHLLGSDVFVVGKKAP